jgi:hypothetical protein
MIIVQISDFTGFWAIATSNKTEDNLQEMIDLQERMYIDKLLGKELADLFVEDLEDGVPQDEIFTAIFEPFTDNCGNYSRGIKDILKGLIYHDYVSPNQSFHSQSGIGINEVDTTAVQSFENAARNGEIRWNDAIESYEVVQKYITDNLSTYPTYDGKKLKVKFSSIL